MSDMEVLDLCIELWTEMRDKGYASRFDKLKTDFTERHPELESYLLCACCKQVEIDCTKCFLRELWEGEDGRYKGIFYTPCEDSPSSPYRSFFLGKGTPADAQKIIDFCVEKKRELESEARK